MTKGGGWGKRRVAKLKEEDHQEGVKELKEEFH